MKKLMKISVFAVLTLLIILGASYALPKSNAAKETVNGIEFTYDIVDGSAVVSEISANGYDDVFIPETLGGYPVEKLSGYNTHNYKNLIIPATVKEITMKYFSFGDGLENIRVDEFNEYFSSDGNGVLYNKDKTKLIRYPQGKSDIDTYTVAETVTEIGEYAFEETKLIDITIPGNVKIIRSYAFIGSTIEKLTINEGTEIIGSYVFNQCDTLNDITLPDSLKVIDLCAFNGMAFTSNKENYDEDGVLYISDYLICSLDTSTLTNYTVKEGTRIIAGGALDWDALEEITIPASVESIGPLAMINVENRKKVNISPDNEHYCTDEYGILYTKDMKELVAFTSPVDLTCYVIPEGVERLSSFALYRPGVLKNVYIPKSVTHIGCACYSSLYKRTYYYEGSAEEFAKITRTCDAVFHHRFDDYIYINITPAVVYNSYASEEHKLTQINRYEYSCTVEGGEEYTCSCGYVFYDIKGGEGHEVSETASWVTYSKPSCETDGVRVKYCSECGQIAEREVYTEKYGHSYQIISRFPASCTSDGKINYRCQKCYTEYTEIVKSPGHVDRGINYTKAPTCTEDGAIYRVCKVCTQRYEVIETLPATGHRSSTWITNTEATCNSQGKEHLKCNDCSYTLDSRTTPLLGHKYVAEIISQTCTERKLKNTCERCGISYYSTIKQNHAAGEWEYIGGKSYAVCCTICDKEIERKEVSVTLDKNAINLKIGESKAISATASVNISDKIIFTSSDKSVATVTNDGVITAVGYGTANIRATINGTSVNASCVVSIETPKTPDIYIRNNRNNETTVNYGEQIKLTANVSNRPDGAKVVWYINGKESGRGKELTVSCNSAVFVTVVLKDASGKVIRDSEGNQLSDSIKINVKDNFSARFINFFRSIFGIKKTVTLG